MIYNNPNMIEGRRREYKYNDLVGSTVHWIQGADSKYDDPFSSGTHKKFSRICFY